VTGAASHRSWLSGLIGHGVGPSLTPELHEREAARQGLRYVYKVIDQPDGLVDHERLARLLGAAVELGFDGLNVTHPAKQAMVALVDEVSPEVAAIGALNTVLVRDGRTVGHNTDVSGFRRSFLDTLPDAERGRVVLVGAGGAGTAVAHALAELGIGRLLVVDLDPGRASGLAATLGDHPTEVELVPATPEGLAAAMAGTAGLVNASPMGMAAHPGSPVPERLLRPDLWVADIVYRPLATALLGGARAAGCTVLSGAGMAVHQAADAFELITGRVADRDAMLRDFDELVLAESMTESAATTTSSTNDPTWRTTGERNR
jgi:shikimate dehydrogenase